MRGYQTPPTTTTCMGHDDPGEVHVVRPTLTVAHRCYKYNYVASQKPGWRAQVRQRVWEGWRCSRGCVWRSVVKRVPILGWLPAYNLRANLFGDVVGGITVGIMHIPQGMAYALLGGLPPITGLYMAFFPVLMYICLGTSRHVSMGTFSVACLMMAKVVGELSSEKPTSLTLSNTTLEFLDHTATTTAATLTNTTYTPQQVSAVVAFAVGMWEVLLAVVQLGEVFSMFLSDMLISGFTTGVAVHVVTSQVKYLFGISVPRFNGPFRLIYTYKEVVTRLTSANPMVMGLSALFMVILIFNNEILKPRVKKYTRLPIPIELLVVVTGTAVSYLANLSNTYHVQVVGEIPTGLPSPSEPPLELLSRVAMDAFIIGVISYTTTFSMAKIFAKRQGYTVDAKQELYSQGASNLFGSFFSCGPMAAAMSRSLIQEAVGGVTLITSFISCLFILIVLLFIGPVFETLPNCVLSTIIVVSLKGLFLQFHDLAALWATSKLDALIWVVTFSVSVIVDIDYGLMAGVGMSLLVLLARNQCPPTARLGHVPYTDVYLDLTKYQLAEEVAGVRIFQFGGALHFANIKYFRSKLVSVTGLDLAALITARLDHLQNHNESPEPTIYPRLPSVASISECQVSNSKTQETILDDEISPIQGSVSNGSLDKEKLKQVVDPGTLTTPLTPTSHPDTGIHPSAACLALPEVQWMVLEMSGVTFVDTMGARVLTQLHKDLRDAGIKLCLAGATDGVERTLSRCGTLDAITRDLMFHSTHDALTAITHSQLNLPSHSLQPHPPPSPLPLSHTVHND
ncbi:solute carrier family 26 member 6-like isoform X2 [Homarus americanus]|nr:solute carrier family 26 member 6-like isoform X2 [Homarus americanus]XP_042227634.1 solute carrier family 26 member 6-like isoform X2 [Homarus americanus]XP_042227635.1 solute carrier family 26 member 6-like isoform X2 [Homarus americanus]